MDTDKEKTKELDLSFQKINWDEFNGSAYRVSGDQIRNLPISNLGNALAGLVPGFYSRQKSGGILNELLFLDHRFLLRALSCNPQ